MNRSRWSILGLLVVAAGCSAAVEPELPQDAAAAADPNAWSTYGAAVGDGDVVAVDLLLAEPDRYAGQTVRVEGEIDTVCKAKGCWMTLAAGDRSMRVTFKDYGFFVPTDAEDRTVIVEGTFAVETVPVDEVRHYLEDAGKHAEAAQVTEPKQEFRLVATGVRMAPAQAAPAGG